MKTKPKQNKTEHKQQQNNAIINFLDNGHSEGALKISGPSLVTDAF